MLSTIVYDNHGYRTTLAVWCLASLGCRTNNGCCSSWCVRVPYESGMFIYGVCRTNDVWGYRTNQVLLQMMSARSVHIWYYYLWVRYLWGTIHVKSRKWRMLGIFSICFRKQSKSENMQGSHDAAPVPATIFWFTVTHVVFGPRISCCRIESKQLELEGAQQVMLGRIFGLLAHFMSSTAVREIPKLRMQHGRNIGRTIILQKKSKFTCIEKSKESGTPGREWEAGGGDSWHCWSIPCWK